MEIEDIEIVVWDCKASLRVKTQGIWLEDDDFTLLLSPKEADKLRRLMKEAVNEQGAINISAVYLPSEKLIDFIEEIFRKKQRQLELLIKRKHEENELKSKIKELQKQVHKSSQCE